MSAPDIENTLSKMLYSSDTRQVSGVKEVIETLKDRVQYISPVQMKSISYLQYLQSRKIHNDNPYQPFIDMIINESYRVAPPNFFIRVIEALIPRPTYIDGKAAQKLAREGEGS